MTIIIIAVTIILYVILLGFTWHNLDILENSKKIIFIIFALLAIVIVTLIIFNISTSGIEYENYNMIANVRNMLVAVFTPVNGLIVMPYVANMIGKIKQEDITQPEFKKKTIIIGIIFIIILIVECNYFKDTQMGILDIINKL